MTEDEMVGWHHQLNGHEFEQPPRVGDGQGSLACCSPWAWKADYVRSLKTSHPLSCPSPPAFNLSQHQSLFK